MTPIIASLTSQRIARLMREHLRREFVALSKVPLTTRHCVHSCGVYALYYNGAHPLYGLLKEEACCEIPIYAGVTIGSLDKRLKDHQTSLDYASFDIQAFSCRIFPTTADLAKSAEDMLIKTYGPIWNQSLSGFGLHNPGKGRAAGKVSNWDLVHSGRPWVHQPTDAMAKLRLEAALAQTLLARLGALQTQNNMETESSDSGPGLP